MKFATETHIRDKANIYMSKNNLRIKFALK